MNQDTFNQFSFWWSIISTVLALGFLCWDIWQLSSSKKEKEIRYKEKELHKSQVKVWQHFANGISFGLAQLIEAIKNGSLSELSAKNIGDAIKPIQATANSLFTSLNEERLFSDEEIKQRQLDNEERIKNMFQTPSVSHSLSVSPKKESI